MVGALPDVWGRAETDWRVADDPRRVIQQGGYEPSEQKCRVHCAGKLRHCDAGLSALPPQVLLLNSVASFVSFPILAAYSVSKAATHSLTQFTRAMLRGQNTQVFGVYPGPIDTRMGEALTLEKASPADAGRAIVAGIIAGNEEIFPDKMSQGAGPAFFPDPKGLERQVAGGPAEESWTA